MASPSEKLAASLDLLKKALGNSDRTVVRSDMLTRTHRERLVANGFLTEILKGWYILTRPEEKKGDSTSWYTSFWQLESGR